MTQPMPAPRVVVPLVFVLLLVAPLVACQSPQPADRHGALRTEALGRASEDMETPMPGLPSEGPAALPAPLVTPPVAPGVEAPPLGPAPLSIAEAVALALPGWDIEFALSHPDDPPARADRRLQTHFRGGTLEQFLNWIERTWNLAAEAPAPGLIELSTRRLEAWGVSHWMPPPAGQGVGSLGGGGGLGGSTNAQGLQGGLGGPQGGQSVGQGQTAQSSGFAGGGGADQSRTEALDALVVRLAQIAGDSAENTSGAAPDGGTREDSGGRVWVNQAAGLLHLWAAPRQLAAMRPLLRQYGARPVPRELEAMMTRGHFRLRMSLVRIAVNNSRNASLRLEESLQAVMPAESLVGSNGLLDFESESTLSGGSIDFGAEAEFKRGEEVFAEGSSQALARREQAIEAQERAIEAEQAAVERMAERVNARLDRLRGDQSDGEDAAISAEVAREISELEKQSDRLNNESDELAWQAARLGVSAANAAALASRIADTNEARWTRALSLTLALGSAYGEAETTQSVVIDAQHGQSHPVQVGNERVFIGSITQTANLNFSQTSAAPETKHEGLSMVLLPWLEDRRCVRVALVLNNTGVASIERFNVGENELRIPQMSVQSWSAERQLCDGAPAIIARFKLTTRDRDSGGAPVPGGRQIPLSRTSASRSVEYLLMLQAVLPPAWQAQPAAGWTGSTGWAGGAAR